MCVVQTLLQIHFQNIFFFQCSDHKFYLWTRVFPRIMLCYIPIVEPANYLLWPSEIFEPIEPTSVLLFIIVFSFMKSFCLGKTVIWRHLNRFQGGRGQGVTPPFFLDFLKMFWKQKCISSVATVQIITPRSCSCVVSMELCCAISHVLNDQGTGYECLKLTGFDWGDQVNPTTWKSIQA